MSNNIFDRDGLEKSFGEGSGTGVELSDVQASNMFQRSHLDGNTMLSQVCGKGQEDLRLAQNIALLKVEIQILTICEIVEQKILNRTGEGFRNMKQIQINNKIIAENEKELFVKVTNKFFQKANNIFQQNTKRNLGIAFGRILLLSEQNRIRLSDKSESCVSPYRINSKIQHSDRLDSEWELAQSQGYDKTENAVRENKFLKKKKERLKNNQNEFLNKMDQLLSNHEAFLKRK